MLSRCNNPEDAGFHRYGGRGITVCHRWETFENFFTDMGDKPPGHSLDRVKNHLGYSKGNCRWATPTEQCRNTRRNRWLTANGETKLLVEWAEQLGSKSALIVKRLARGWTEQEACTTPAKNNGYCYEDK
jgi:hypothetical protein